MKPSKPATAAAQLLRRRVKTPGGIVATQAEQTAEQRSRAARKAARARWAAKKGKP